MDDTSVPTALDARFSHVSLDIFNILGQRVETVLDRAMPAGRWTVTWDARNYASGVYFCRMRVGESSRSTKMLLLK